MRDSSIFSSSTRKSISPRGLGEIGIRSGQYCDTRCYLSTFFCPVDLPSYSSSIIPVPVMSALGEEHEYACDQKKYDCLFQCCKSKKSSARKT